MSTKSIGNKAEEYVARFLSDKGWFVILIPQKITGQPFDLVAFKDDEFICGDVKHIQSGISFPFRRIEPNQETSFKMMRLRGNSSFGIFMKYEGDDNVYFSYWDDIEIKKLNGKKSIRKSECEIL